MLADQTPYQRSRAVAVGVMYAAPLHFGSVMFAAPPMSRRYWLTPSAYPATISRAWLPGPAFGSASRFSTTLRLWTSVMSASTCRFVPFMATWSSYRAVGPRYFERWPRAVSRVSARVQIDVSAVA